MSWILVMIYISYEWSAVVCILSPICLCCCVFFVKRYCTCQWLISTLARFKILQFFLFIYTSVHVPSVVRSLQFRKGPNTFAVYKSEGSAGYKSYPLCPSHYFHAIIKHLQKLNDHEQCYINQISWYLTRPSVTLLLKLNSF